MKTSKYCLLIAITFFVLNLPSCNNPIGLGVMLDIEGPVVDFTSPSPRRAVPIQFDITGTVSDNSFIQKVILKASSNNEEYPKQWRYFLGVWEVSEDFGVSWSELPEAEWNGNNYSANWKIPVDLSIDGEDPADGEYIFTVQAWDQGNFTGALSFKSLVLIIDRDPPKVEITSPFLFNTYYYNAELGAFTGELQTLHTYTNTSPARFEPANIGKFLTQGFQLQWQIDDNHDVWSIDIRFYNHDVNIDGYPDTPLPDNYIYHYYRNLPPPPEIPVPENNLKPSGSVIIPSLISPQGIYDEGGVLENPITEKTTIKVVTICYDSAGNPNQEKTLGYFVYWPLADKAWIIYSSGMEKPEVYANMDENELKQEAFMIYPGRNIKATAFQAQGVSKVVFSLHNYNEKEPDFQNRISDPISLGYMENFEPTVEFDDDDKTQVVRRNDPRFGEILSTIFPWEFRPPNRTGFYVVKAAAYDSNNNPGDEWQSLFMVQDITYPDFTVQPSPVATEPLFMHINNSDNSITISGRLSDATQITSLTMVWINPESRNFAAMSQLQYFRDPEYAGWEMAKELQPGHSAGEVKNVSLYGNNFPYDESKPNRLWNLALTPMGEDPDTNRQRYSYSQRIHLHDELNIGEELNIDGELIIGIGGQPLKSQIFLLRAENPNNKTTIITYAPQGDTLPPEIVIDSVTIMRGAEVQKECIPGEYALIPKFEENDRIIITGSWKEDSTEYLNVQRYLYPSIKISVNGNQLNIGPNDISTAAGNNTQGTFTVTGTFSDTIGPLLTTAIKDTIVVNAVIEDIGGNPAEFGASWLIESDALRFLRISSSDPDMAYKAGDEIELFLEFSKPVTLNKGTANDPVLILNTGGRAYYGRKDAVAQSTESSRQYFTYIVGENHKTTNLPENFLNVTGLSVNGGETNADTGWDSNNYPFRWQFKQSIDNVEVTEDMRIVTQSTYSSLSNTDKAVYAPLPVASDNSSLVSGKEIIIDTTAPGVSGVTVNPTGWHRAGKEIFITVTFNKNVKIVSTDLPYLNLNTGGRTSSNAADVRLNNNAITFKYTVQSGDDEENLKITSYGGTITDIPGTALTAFEHIIPGVHLDNTPPGFPFIQIYSGTAPSVNEIDPVTVNLYNSSVYIHIDTSHTGNAHLSRIEYTTNNGVSWASSETHPVNVQLASSGSYTVKARQVDKAGNVSEETSIAPFTWNPGELVTRIDSTSANGIYTNNGLTGAVARQDNVNITVYFRENITTSGTLPTLTLNVTPSRTVQAAAHVNNQNSISFTYSVNNNENTPAGVPLDVTSMAIFADDQSGVSVTNLLNVPGDTTDLSNVNRLRNRKAIIIQTGELRRANLSTGAEVIDATTPTFIPDNPATITANDAWTGYFDLRFTRSISKGSGNITITQVYNTNSDTLRKYRLPAVLTEAQASKYRSITNFDTFYKRGVNGLSGTAPDTSTKFILNYSESTIVEPSNAVAASDINKMAYDFHQAEIVTIPLSSQDIEIVNGHTLRIKLTGSNALAVLGAEYRINIPPNAVQDTLSYTWPAAAIDYNYITSGINKPFIRIDKKVDADQITRAAGNANGTPQMSGLFTNVLQTTARLDCRTPGSVVRYNAGWYEHAAVTGDVNAHGHGSGAGPNWRNSGAADAMITFADTGTNSANLLIRPVINDEGNTESDSTTTGVRTYNIFTGTGTADAGPHFTVGNTNESGYTLRIAARSHVTADGTTRNSSYSEEVAFRSVLTYELRNVNGLAASGGTASIGWRPMTGNTLWIRGGDAPGVSSIVGFPLTWDDDYQALSASGGRAGVRAMRRVQGNSPQGEDSIANAQIWRWVTWEINVNTYNEVILGENFNATATGTPTVDQANEAWQYGPRMWRYPRGGWVASKHLYTIYPGRHRWVRLVEADTYSPGARVNWTTQTNIRPTTLTVTAP